MKKRKDKEEMRQRSEKREREMREKKRDRERKTERKTHVVGYRIEAPEKGREAEEEKEEGVKKIRFNKEKGRKAV